MLNENALALGTARSVIRELFEYGNRRAAVIGRENVLDFSLGNPGTPCPEAVNDAIRDILRDTDSLLVHGYTSAPGDMDARQAVAEELSRRFGIAADPERLFFTCGAAPALCAVFGALAVEKGEILAISPYFPEYKPFVQGSGLIFRAIPADIPGFQIDFTALEQALNSHTQALILNSPNNPSGTVYSEATLRRLAGLLEEKSAQYGHPIYIVSDEPYRELCYEGRSAPWIPSLYRDTVVCYSWSKSLSLPGERIGYVYVNPQARDSGALYGAVCGAAREKGHVCAPSLWQKVIGRCAELGPDLSFYDRNRRLLRDGLTAMGYEMAEPQGAFYLFLKVPGGDGLAFSAKAQEKDLLVVPGEGFGCPGYVRLCYCVKEAVIRKALPVFGALLEEFSPSV